eukprot:3067365-Pyramimonas_sp.AAC.1
MELSKMIDVVEYEEEANASVVAHEARLHSEATAEARRAVERHEGSLTERAAQEMGRTRKKSAMTSSSPRPWHARPRARASSSPKRGRRCSSTPPSSRISARATAVRS